MMNKERDRCITLAAIFQAAQLVFQIAHRGSTDAVANQASIYSLFQIDADSVPAVFGESFSGLSVGIHQLHDQLTNGEKQEREVLRYVIMLMHLERKLARQPAMLEKIGEGIQLAILRLEHFPMLHTNILAQLAELYTETVSRLPPKIMVQGEHLHLENPDNMNRIRALLLAGIRAAHLWRQCGGGRLQIIFGRKRLTRMVEELITEIKTDVVLH